MSATLSLSSSCEARMVWVKPTLARKPSTLLVRVVDEPKGGVAQVLALRREHLRRAQGEGAVLFEVHVVPVWWQ